ncbi:MAG: serine protein kinase PrkA [Deltaproteobacteria bacterium]|nr:MAG: serine protein kinase PrkA [Deltaproteobacteria bacterium]
MDSLRYLQSVGEQVRHAFVGNKTILSFQEYMEGFFEKPRVHARDAAQYIRDCFDFYGTTTANNPGGAMRRFKLFDRPFDQGPGSLQEGEGGAPVCGHEEVQNAIYRILNGFVRAGRINKLILLHGPNGSAKSSIVAAIQRALEDYSRKEEGQLYRFNWIFPSEKLVKGSIGFGENAGKGISGERVETYAHLEGEAVDARIHCELKDHPLHLVPRMERQRMLRETTKPDSIFQLSQAMLEGELCHKCRQIYAALLQSYNGDVLKVLRHVQVERFYISRRYMHGAVTVEPQMAVDADYRQVTHDRSHGALPGALQNLALFEPYGPLVAGNRGVIEFSDLLKRPLEHYKYLLGTVETGVARAPHSVWVAAQWAVLTRMKKPVSERYKGELRKLVDHLTPLEKLQLYDRGEAPARLAGPQGRELKKHVQDLWRESDAYPNYEGRTGASARELKTVISNAAQNPRYKCLTPQAILLELEELVKDKSVYEFLQQEVVDGYHDHEEFVRVVENEHLDVLDEEVRDAMGLVSEKQYRELFERYVQHVLAWTRGERVRNKLTGEMERPDEEMMAQTEAIVMTGGEERREFRRALIANIGAHRIDHPEGEIDYSQIFPDLFRRLRDHFFDERKRILRKNSEKMLRYLGEDRAQLSVKEIAQVESTLGSMKERFRYCDNCAKDALLLLLTKRYTD